MARLDLPSERYVSTFSFEDASLSFEKEPRKGHLAETESRAGENREPRQEWETPFIEPIFCKIWPPKQKEVAVIGGMIGIVGLFYI